jgi:hypothetical protein
LPFATYPAEGGSLAGIEAMKFSDVIDGVVALSGFVVGNATWLTLTLWIIDRGTDGLIFSIATNFSVAISQWILEPSRIATFDSLGVKPLLPFFLLSMVVFALHIHGRIVDFFGSYIPPEISTVYMVGEQFASAGAISAQLYGTKYANDPETFTRLVKIEYGKKEEDFNDNWLRTLYKAAKFYFILSIIMAGYSLSSNAWRAIDLIGVSIISVAVCFLVLVKIDIQRTSMSAGRYQRAMEAVHAANMVDVSEEVSDDTRKELERRQEAMRGSQRIFFGVNIPFLGYSGILTQGLRDQYWVWGPFGRSRARAPRGKPESRRRPRVP